MEIIQTAKEIKKCLKMDKIEALTMQIEDLKESVVNSFEDITKNKDERTKVVETKQDIEARLKKLTCASYTNT